MNNIDRKEKIIAYYNQEAKDYINQYKKPAMEQEVYPANAIRLEIILKLLHEHNCKSVLDVGCGSGGPLIRFLQEGYDACGFDFSEEMVSTCKKQLQNEGFDSAKAFHGDIEIKESLPQKKFDGIVATGVFPHNIDDHAAYDNLNAHLKRNGVALIEYRNILMSLFSLNRYSEPFFWHDLIDGDKLTHNLCEETRKYLANKFDTDIKSVGKPRTIEYANILARFHNPLTLAKEIAAYGFKLLRVHYYHYHCTLPHLEKDFRTEFWESSIKMENPQDWRGMFLCSAFVAEIKKM
jgi:SAM-dependent methyltransferase